MDEETKEQKKKETEEFVAKQEVEAQTELEELAKDHCPICKERIFNFPYNAILPYPFLWIECPKCGMVFCPTSIRRRKLRQAVEAQKLVQPATEMPEEPVIEVVGARKSRKRK